MSESNVDDWLPMANGQELPPDATWHEADGQDVARWTLPNGRGLERRDHRDGRRTWWLTTGPDSPPRIVSESVCARIPPDDLQRMS